MCVYTYIHQTNFNYRQKTYFSYIKLSSFLPTLDKNKHQIRHKIQRVYANRTSITTCI